MKKYVVLPVFLVFLAACSSPLLKWIETPTEILRTSISDKAITSFSFGMAGEDDVIRATPGEDERTPITVILPAGTDPGNLAPAVEFIGKSLDPPSLAPRDFNNPVVYRVTAEDSSYREYVAQVHVKNAHSGAILWFDLELPGAAGHVFLSEGIISETAGEGGRYDIVLHVPSGTDTRSLAAQIVQTGAFLDAPDRTYDKAVINLTGDFSVPQVYTVRAEDGSRREYLVTVLVDKSNAKEITAFSFAGWDTRAQVIIGGVPQPDGTVPILAEVPAEAGLSGLTPVITYTGDSIAGAGVSGTGGPGTVRAAEAVDFDGSAVNPRTYTVTAEDGSVRTYAVTALSSNRDSGKQITGFYFLFPNAQGDEGAAGVINETAKTIAVTVPFGTELRSLSPVIYHTGASISPISGAPVDFSNSVAEPVPYTVTARNDTTQTYRVSVFVAASDAREITGFGLSGVPGAAALIGTVPGADGNYAIVVMVPPNTGVAALQPVITHTGHAISGPEVSSTAGPGTVNAAGTVDFTAPQVYQVTAENGQTRDYTVTVVKTADPVDTTARIDVFYLSAPLAIGVINETAKTIDVTVPWDTNLAALTAVIYYTGAKIRQGSGTEHEENPAHIISGFAGSDSSPVPFTVTGRGDSPATATYGVRVQAPPKPPSDARAISVLFFEGVETAGTTTVIAAVPDSEGVFPIDVTVPMGTNISALKPVITHTGVFITGEGISGTGGPGTVPAGSAVDFNSPRSYRVTAESGRIRDYTVTVREDDNNAKEITGFYFTQPLAVGAVDQAGRTITVTVPSGTNVSALRPTVFYTGVSLDPVSGQANNFSSPAIYTVTARNGTVRPYEVRVIPRQSSARDITAFTFPGAPVLDTIIGAVPGPDGKIPISIVVSGSTDIGSLTPSITYTGKSISPGPGTQDFSVPVSYRVSAEDGSVKDYAVSVHRLNNSSKVITGFSFPVVPLGASSVSAVASIDQESRVIEVRVPHAADISGLAPLVTWIGKSITPPGGGEGTGHPLRDSARDFTGSVSYKVTAEDGSSLDYTVTVGREEQNLGVTVIFQGITDSDFVGESFDQSTGTVTVGIKGNTGYSSPYEWYLDGRKLTVSAAEPQLILKIAGMQPGQHEVTAVAKKISDGKHYSNKVYFLVQEQGGTK